jgi:ParB-like chromosome segregation protein Spo0J
MTAQLCEPYEITAIEALHSLELLPVESLHPADSPRLNGISHRHAEVLAESEDDLPAILVQRGTMRVIDGMHRVHAARLKGHVTIAVRFADVDDDAAFLLAVEANIAHGLPLSLADRKAAASRIIEARHYWSDRAIAKASGLSWKTVGMLRARAHAPSDGDKRVGRDGKVRPVNGAAGRQLAGELLTRNPDAGLREIARVAGVSAATVRDVRDRLNRGEDVLTPAQLRHLAETAGDRHAPAQVAGPANVAAQVAGPARPDGHPRPCDRVRSARLEPRDDSMVDKLKVDPSLRYSDTGRALLHLLHARPSSLQASQMIRVIPAHCLNMTAQVSRQIALEWMDFATAVEHRDRLEMT